MSIETLDVASTLNVVQDEYGSNKYVLNGNTTYDSNNNYTLQIGTYQLAGIPSSHPLAIVDITDSNQVSYTGLLANKTTVSGVDYYVGDITINVIGNFGTASIKCSNHGYMGGQDLLQYVADVVINPDNGNISYANSGVSTSNKITKKYYKDLKGNSDIFFNERVRIKSNNIICSHSDKTVDIQHTQNDQIYIIGSKQSNGSSVLSHSNNGKTWNPIPLTINGTTIFTHVRGVAYSPESELWIACGSGNNTLAYSIDGIQWTGLGKTIFGDVAYSVAYANGKWIAVGGNTPNTIAYSSNGVSWTGVGTSIFTNCGKAIGYGNGIWVAGGQGTNTMAYSVDGINWTGLGDTIFDEQCNVVKYADSKWVAGGGKDIPNTLAYSTDGINWTGKRYNNIRNYTYGIDYANGLWIAGGGQKDEGYVGGTPRNWVLVSDTITDWNGGFELPVVGYYEKFENFGANFSIPGWSWAVGTPGYEANKGPSFGRNPSNGTPIPGSGYQTIGLRYGHSLSKTISGILHHGSVYQIKLMAVTQYGKYDQSLSSPTIKVYYNGTEISEFTFRMMDGDLPVLVDYILFTASGNNHEIVFEHQGVDNYTMLMDDIQLFEDTLSYLDISASDLSGIDISAANVGTDLSGTSWTLESATMVNWNGGFEADALDVNHFVKMGRDDPFGGVLTGWTYTKGTHSSWGPTLINGNNSGFGNQAIIHGTQIIGLRYGQTLSKSLVGLTTGKTYKLRYQRHARVAQTGIEYRVYLNDTTNILKQETVTTQASEVEANRLVEIDFTAPDSSATLTLEQLTGGDEMVWFDKFELYLDKSSGTFDTTSAINSIEWYLKSDSITNWNGSFETDAVAIGDYYIVGSTANGSNNGPATLTGWTQETTNESYGAILVNKSSSQMYDNTQYNGGLTNGAVIQGNQAVGLHMGTKLKKTINDLTAGTDYKISFEVFKFDKSQGQVNYSVQLDSAATTLLLTTEITNGETSTISERTRTVEFKATQTSHTLLFVADSGTTWNMFFLDNVKLFQKMSGKSIDFGSISKIPSGTIGQETADDNAFDNNWTTNYHNTIMLSLDFNTVFAGEGLSIALAGDAGISSNYAPNTGPLQWHFNVDAVSAGWQSNQTLIPGIYNATYSFVLPNTTYTKALGVGADGDKGVIISKTFSASSTVKVVYGYGRIDSTTGADLGGSGDGASAVITVAGVEIDSTTEPQKTVTFDVNSGETMEIKGSLLLYALEDFTPSESSGSGSTGGVSVETPPTWSLISDSISDWNGGFEDDALSSNSFKKYGHDDPFGGAITGWTFTTGTHATWGPTLVNGSGSAYGNQGILHGSQAIGLRYEQTLTKSLTGLTAGKRYKLSYQRHNRQGQNNIQYKVYSGEETNVYLSETVTTDSSEAESNRDVEIVFIPFDTTQSFTLKQLTGGDVSIWFDKFELYEDTGGYSAGSTLYEYPPNEIQTALDNYTLNMSTSTENGSNFTVSVSGSTYGNGDYIIQTTSNGDNDSHNPKNLFDKREDSYYGSYDAFLPNWGASQANAIKYNSDGTPNSSASELVSGVKGEWVSITLPDNIVLTKYYIKDRVNHNGSSLSSYIGNASPLSWKLYGSNDGSSYTEIDSNDDDDTIKNNGAMELNVSPSAGYNQYVLVITKVNNKTWFGLGEFKLFGVSAAAGEDSSSGNSDESSYTWATPVGPPYDLTANVLKPYTGNVVSRPYTFETFDANASEISESSSEIPATTTTPAGHYKTYKLGDEYIRTGILNLYFANSVPMYNYTAAFFDRINTGNTSFNRKGRYIWQSESFTNITFADVTVNGAAQYFTFLSSDTTKASYIRIFSAQDYSAYFENYTPSEVKIYGTNDDVTATLLATNSSFKTDLAANAANANSNNLYTNYSYTTPQGNSVNDMPAYVDITLDSSAETTGYKKYYIAYSGSVGTGRMLGGWVQFYFNLPGSGGDGSWVNNNEIANGGHQFANKDDLRTALQAWVSNKTNAIATYGEINTWDTSLVTTFANLFQGFGSFDEDISNWNTSNVTNMSVMFVSAYVFNNGGQPMNTKKVTVNGVSYVAWDTSKVTNFFETFRTAYRFNQDITNWNTSNATSFERMFRGGANSNHDFNQDISTKSVTVDGATYTAWDTSNITTMKSMFEETSEPDYSHSFKQNIRNWNTTNVTDYTNMFRYSSMHLDYSNVSGFGDTPTASFFNQ